MAHIVFAAPGIDRFHLHERLQRELTRRLHTVTTLCANATARDFFSHQGLDCHLLSDGDAAGGSAPIDEFVRRDPGLGRGQLDRTRRRLQRLETGLRRWFEHNRVDLMLLHQQRGADHALLHFVAREHGCRVLWTGDGLLPHTMQIDGRGLDGEATASHRRVLDYRVVRAEPMLVAASLTHALADTQPFALTPKQVLAPPLRTRFAAMPAAFATHGLGGVLETLTAWRRARTVQTAPLATRWLPAAPFVAVLLQERHDARLRLDTTGPIADRDLITAAARCAAALDPACSLVVVDPRRRGAMLRPERAANGVLIHRLPPSTAANVAATAACTVTINHPAASVALLAGTPVVHLGSALYGLPGVTTRSDLDGLDAAIAKAMTHDHPTLRQRFLTWLFGYGHLWCSASHPDHNGLLGLVKVIEDQLGKPVHDKALPYRSGPAWPLAAEGRS